ncbi:uncharacterized protein N7483_011631 [Penicillium malachiteum]|uniref:uncharacterized protein n=1 Tax=Penicillium malachiteum TaxID=1324776 RepID=UPI0025480191|nr:uncharacterized protein N7483_011631 [Penicillium malachiteum]KAJ5714450.1 hypothetical protein N7483_011631 [Penicillium malachiteum]
MSLMDITLLMTSAGSTQKKVGHPPKDGAIVSEKVREDAMSKINIFRSWVEEQVLNASNDATLRVVIVPQGRPGANYRDGTPGT